MNGFAFTSDEMISNWSYELAGLSMRIFNSVSVRWSYRFFPAASCFKICRNSAAVAMAAVDSDDERVQGTRLGR